MTAVDKIVFGNIFGDRHAKLVRFSCLDLSILACRIVWCLLRRNMQLPDVHSSKECVLRRQLVQRFLSLSLTSLDFLETDIDKNCLRFCAV